MSETWRQIANFTVNQGPSKTIRQTRTRVIVTTQGEIYQVLNPPENLMPSIPGTNTVPFASHVRPYIQTPDEFNKRGWEYEGVLPYRGFVPVETAFHDGLFSCLGYSEGTIPLDRSVNGEWTIRASLLDRWKYLEKLLSKLRAAFAPVGVSSEYVSVSSPLGYLRMKGQGRKILQAKGLLVIKSFVLLMAEVSHRIAMFYQSDAPELSQHYNRILQSESLRLSYSERDLILISPLVDFTLPRNGLFVHLRRSKSAYGWDHALSPYLLAQVPLFLYWGHRDDLPLRTSADMVLHSLNLTAEQVHQAEAFDPPVPVEPTQEKETTPTIDPEPFGSIPPVDISDHDWRHDIYRPGWTAPDESMGPELMTIDKPVENLRENPTTESTQPKPRYEPSRDANQPSGRQLIDETWQEFFIRLARKAEKIRGSEQPKQRSARENREAVASSKRAPGKSGARVFRWETVRDDGYRLRTHVPRWQVPDLWQEYTDSQKRFNSFDNEWDVCSDFAPDDEMENVGEEDDDDDDDDDGYFIGLKAQSGPVNNSSAVDTGKFVEEARDVVMQDATAQVSEIVTAKAIEEVEARQVEPPQDDLEEGEMLENDENKEFLEENISSLDPTTQDPWLPPVESAELWCLEWSEAVHFRYGYNNPINDEGPPLSSQERSKFVVVGYALCARLPNVTANAAREITRAFGNFSQGVDVRDTDLHPSHRDFLGTSWNRSFRIDPIRSRGVFRIQDQSHPLKVEVTDATTALHVLRASHLKNIYDVLSEFLRLGIAFCPQVVEEAPTTYRPLPRVWGYRPEGWKPSNTLDFQTYVTTREHFLRHPIIARAGLRNGGLIWRLALEANGLELLDGRTYMEGYVPATLTDEDIDVICGVYKVGTSYLGTGPGVAISHSSWFPRPIQWSKSTFNVGFWCEFAEIWYQGLLEKIQLGTYSFRTAGEWGSAIRLQTKRLALAKKMRNQAELALYDKVVAT